MGKWLGGVMVGWGNGWVGKWLGGGMVRWWGNG